MYRIDEILEKVNTSGSRSTPVTLPNFFSRSLPEVRDITGDSLSRGETRYLYRQAQHEQNENRLAESRILARANPQLANAVRLGIRQAAGSRSYDDWFGSRADRFARPGSVASMFSPAAYLTELYREAKDLHPATSQFRLDTRRPDLATLALSQNNMDDELSTLSLSNELLYRAIGAAEGLDDDGVRELLAGYRLTGQTPWHRAYEAARQAILVQDPALAAFSRNPDVAQLIDPASLLAIESDISPELYRILTEEITADNSAELWAKNFGDVSVSMFTSPDYLARYYDIDHDTLASLLGIVSLSGIASGSLLTEVNIPKNLACRVTALGEQRYRVRFTILKSITDLGFGLYMRGWLPTPPKLYWKDSSFKYARDIEYTVDITVPDDDFINNTLTFDLWQSKTSTAGLGIATVTVTRIKADNDESVYLKLNKVLRLYKATGLTPAELFQITRTFNSALTIDHGVLSKIFQVRYLMNRYRLDIARALVLCNGLISDQSFNGETGLFTTLFNTPLLNEQLFSADDAPLDFRSEAPEDVFRLNVLGRAFGVSVSALAVLWQMAGGDTGFTCSASNIAALYRTWLLADIHDLSVSELSMLLSVSPYHGEGIGSLSDDALTQLIQFLYQTTAWLTEQGWTVSDMFLMLTTQYSTLLTPDIENLLASLRNGLSGRELSTETLPGEAAPFIAAAMRLDATDTAEAMLTWANQLQPGGLTLTDFILLVMNAVPDENQRNRMAEYCQALGQLALIIHHTGLSTRELTLLVSQPGRFRTGWTRLPHDLPALRDMTRFHAIVNRSGSHAGEVLTALETGELSSALLARALSQNEQDVTGALAQVRGGGDQDGSVFATWEEVDQAEQWLDMSETLSITPSGLAGLIALKYINVSDESAPSYSQWQAVSGLLQAGLNGSQSSALHDYLEEGTSSALCACYLRNLAPVMVSGRDDLFGYLLLDNQVSAQVKTTRIAEAIAGLQLYINRALNGMENSTVAGVRGRQFFTDWEMYNKRYSTWAGVSELVYYPENYLDPTVRIGQTGMMDTLLQSISQSSINRDTVEDAYQTYLTSFEQIANLRIISGYHDNVDNDQGLTYFVGCNDAEEATWYWRSVDHNKIKDGITPANAWTEWLPIHCGLNPFDSVVRPVVFNNYLYIAWLERKETAETGVSGSINPQYSYTLNLSRLRYDGTWSSPVSFELSAGAIETVLNLTSGSMGNQGLELYLSRDNESNVLYGVFYCFQDIIIAGPSVQSDCYFIHIDEFLAMTEVTDKSEQERVYANTVGLYSSVRRSRIIDRRFVDRLSFSYTTNVDPSAVYDLSTHRIVNFSGTRINRASVRSNDEKTITVGVESFISCTLSQQTYTNQAVLDLFTSYYSLNDVIYVTTIPSGNVADVSFACMVNATTRNMVCMFYKDYAAGYADPVSTILHRITVSGLADFSGGTSQTHFVASLTESQINSAILGLLSFSITANLSPGVTGTSQSPVFKEYAESYLYPVNVSPLQGEYLLSYGSLVINSTGSAVFTPVGNRVALSIGTNTLTPDTMVLETGISSEEVNICVAVSHKNAPDTYLAMRYMTVSILYTGSVNTNGAQYITLYKNLRGAQYMDMQISGDTVKVRLNTLFARQLVERARLSIDAVLTLETQKITEPALDYDSNDNVLMDFTGANALYFWELFYYTPMMVFRRLLDERNFPEATRWLQYIWNPAGYVINGERQNYTWNVRPLEEDTGWNDSPLDSVDPDAIAQNDPMHYKVATFMSYLDLLIARGDAAYRLLERDTLNEARMWYVQALNLLGDEPYIAFDADWSALPLGDAASEVTQRDYQQALLAVRRQEPVPDTRTANSLTALFLPQQNGVLKGYWQTLAQRLYNLRHNLSIDGQPLSLSVYATPAEPSALLRAAVNSAQGAAALPAAMMPLYRFPVILENTRGMVSLLIGFGNTLLGITERQDAAALAELLQTQGSELILQGLRQQNNVLAEIDADIAALEESRRGAQMRFERYSALYEADVNTGEKQAMNLYLSSSVLAASGNVLFMAGAAADMLPNIYGMAVGGSRYGALFNATAIGIQVSSDATRISADKISQSEAYRRRREEWEIQRDSAQSDVAQIDAQLAAMTVRREGAELQKTWLETQQTQTQAQLVFLQGKFSNTALYSWLRGRLSAIYYQFYDLAVSRCLMAQQALQWDKLESRSFIQPGAWRGANAGLLAGETLMLNLAQMEQAWLTGDERAKEVTRTVCLSEIYAGLAEDAAFSLAGRVVELVSTGSGSAGTESNGLQMKEQQLQATLKLSDLGIGSDYPAFLGPVRRIKQISVTLPALVGPYQDVRAVLSYGGSVIMPRGCSALAVSHGMNDSGQFQLEFNDPRYLPFEGLPVDDSGILTLSFPDADGRQKDLLLSLTDIILHIRYTIIA